MSLKAEIQEAVKIALKSGDAVTLSTLRLVLSALHNEEIKVRKELTADEIQKSSRLSVSSVAKRSSCFAREDGRSWRKKKRLNS